MDLAFRMPPCIRENRAEESAERVIDDQVASIRGLDRQQVRAQDRRESPRTRVEVAAELYVDAAR